MGMASRAAFFILICSHIYSYDTIEHEWGYRKSAYGLNFNNEYDKTSGKFAERNYEFIKKIHDKNLSYTLAMNQFGHMPKKERLRAKNENIQPAQIPIIQNFNNNKYKNGYHIQTMRTNLNGTPKELDWRKLGIVSPVKYQSQCGSCWAFGVTGAMESHYRLKFGVVKLFSEQHLLDCDNSNHGCKGGSIIGAYKYIKKVGIASEQDYKYKAPHNSPCKINDSNRHRYNLTKIQNFKIIPFSEELLTQTIYKYGPVSVDFVNVSLDIQLYKSGVYEGKKCTPHINRYTHSALAVGFGYDDKSKKDYYIIKNSWGKHWGDHGYMKIARKMKPNCENIIFAAYPIF